jgi:hypothetical protein
MKASRQGLKTCSGANLPLGSHHSAAMAENRATSAGSMDQEGVSAAGGGLAHAASLSRPWPCDIGGEKRQARDIAVAPLRR